MREGVTLNAVLIPSPTMLKLKPEAIRMPVVEGACLTFFGAAKAQVTTSSKTGKAIALLIEVLLPKDQPRESSTMPFFKAAPPTTLTPVEKF
jgi:hypothetical protein